MVMPFLKAFRAARPGLTPAGVPAMAAMLQRPLPQAMARMSLLLPALAMATLPAQAAGPVPAAASTVITPHVRAELLVHAPDGVQPGKPLWLGLSITHQPHWHTYWKNAGDSGLPTTLAWTLPPGFAAGGIAWPVPQRLPLGPLLNYGYEGRVLLPVAVTVPAGFKGAALDVGLHAEWLVCKEICLPESGDFQAAIPAGAPSVAQQALFDATRAATPVPAPGASAVATVDGAALAIDVRGLPAAARGQTLALMAEDAGVIDYPAPVAQRWNGQQLSLRVPLAAQRSESPAVLRMVLKPEKHPSGWTLAIPVEGGWPGADPAQGAAAAPAAAGAINAGATAAAAGAAESAPRVAGAAPAAGLPATSAAPAFLLTLAFALLGGALLNLMPCVFPVLSLKLFSLAQHAAERRRAVSGGIAYTVGVVLSFTALAGLLLALRAGGEQLGWGFQLQSPLVVSLLAALFTLIGLNLAGVFEFGTVLPGRLASYRARNPLLDDALGGALAVAIASPCTAPFMGAALGAALTEPAPRALTIFATLGLGMALPYLAATLWPGLARAMPRPGAWMARFKVLMAFPMFATVVWLLWVLGQQAGIDAMAGLLGVLVALAYAAWTLATPVRTARGRALLAGSGAIVLAGALAVVWPVLRAGGGPGAGNDDGAAASAGGNAGAAILAGTGMPGAAVRWAPWSEQAVAQARAQGRPVFVDFTAAWCVTCQYNKRTVLADASVLAYFDAKRVLLLRADWTRRDPAITRQLAQLGRSGVPVYVLYSGNAGTDAGAGRQLLSELLTVSQVQTALARL